MRADRLLSLLMLLQSRGKMKARELAEALEVSERTIYRDIVALGTAGVPVYGDSGPAGGFALLDTYQTKLTGMTDEELRVLFMLRIPQPLVDLGLGLELKQALLKLSAALPSRRRMLEEASRLRIHLDSSTWKQQQEPLPHLQVVYQAVRDDRCLFIRYQPLYNVTLEAWVDPYGLVAKAGDWYMVCASAGKLVVHQVGQLLEARLGDETFTRPGDFDVAEFWGEWCARKARASQGYRVTVRVFPRLMPYLTLVTSPIKQEQIQVAPGSDGMVLNLDFESLEAARKWLLPLGSGVEVLAPLALRCSVIDFAEQILSVYREA